MLRFSAILLLLSSLPLQAGEPGAALWSLRPLSRPVPPEVDEPGWKANPVDRFIFSRLREAGVTPSPMASRKDLVRRVSFDLTGLPPSRTEVTDFLTDPSPQAYEKVIDRLLSSPRYGERWGRHWLDVARYADSNGLDENIAHGNAWRYRDWVVSSFNADLPYDRFVIEQLAGDLLGRDKAGPEKDRLLIATGFLSLGTKSLAESDLEKLAMDIIDEQINTFGSAFMGLTLGCARCHDHKFDPISMGDYYALAGIFKSTRTMESLKRIAKWNENPLSEPPAQGEVIEKKEKEIARLETALKTTKEKKTGEPVEQTTKRLENARKELVELKALRPAAMGVREDKAVDLRIHLRGSHLDLGELVARRVPSALAGSGQISIPPQSSGRLELARWLTRPGNPLTARVLVNRLWRWHFGRGLVDTPDNFGSRGSEPEHPELLDWLAGRLQDSGWSLKDLHRLIVSSRTYRGSSHHRDESAARDPENRLLWKWPLRRLEAEALRDAILSVSGKLDLAVGGPALKHVKNREFLFDHTSKDLTRYDSPRRTLYLPVIRNHLYDALSLFDFPDPAVTNGNRATTTVAPQGLFLMNSELSLAAGKTLASQVLDDESLRNDTERTASLYGSILGRPPEDHEVRSFVNFLAAAAKRAEPAAVGWQALAQALLLSNEFLHLR